MEQTDEVKVLQPDSVLPCQLPDLASWPARAHWGRVERDPYRKLVLAVLERAWLDATENSRISVRNPSRNGRQGWGHYHHRLRRMKRLDAIYWFKSDSEAVMSFRWCLLALGYEPEAVRNRPGMPQIRPERGFRAETGLGTQVKG